MHLTGWYLRSTVFKAIRVMLQKANDVTTSISQSGSLNADWRLTHISFLSRARSLIFSMLAKGEHFERSMLKRFEKDKGLVCQGPCLSSNTL